ncbi:thiamine pyrophosphate-binding protein [Maritalea porphyrae]|uniref:thiamine pyrophosphate-binding protein n=2 Tax=Maritalea TaxID=623276 RepID=UPI0022AFA85C|nr:thiamine pyrophosphate-binding protein [Maritalea porphyrae]MCZ4273237.1 thiamine pyrophosphate-binding protein [Maritalea porphyrae]
MAKMTGGEILVKCLEAQRVDRVFCVPGESYLAVLDGLVDSNIDVVTSRHEGGAAIMAEADGKMLGRPGICMVTRGPGATNAAAGVHVAKQDSTPMILFVGQIGREMKGRESFQEVDYRQTFGDLAKWVEEIDDASRIPEIIAHAYHIAMSGRPGPVVLALPEDMLRDTVDVDPCTFIEVAEPAPTKKAADKFAQLLADAKDPMVIVGGSRWDETSVAQLQAFSEKHHLPVGCSFRRQQLFDHTHQNYAGDVGLGINPSLNERIAKSDCVILLGARFSENPSQNFSLLGMPNPGKTLIHVHSGAEELGRIYTPTLAINATPEAFFDAVEDIAARKDTGAAKAANAAYHAWTDNLPTTPGDVQMGEIMSHLRSTLADDAILTNGAGNYAIWLHRFWRFKKYGTQLAPTSGSMGYGLPAAIAGKLRHPTKDVICFAGDGCFQMTGNEFGAAMQSGANVITLVIDNGIYGTIRMHQEKHYPARISATNLVNPDFAALARAYGGHGETVERTEQFADAFERARTSGKPSIIHIKIDPEAISPTTTITKLRGA